MSEDNTPQYNPAAMVQEIVAVEHLMLVGQEATEILANHTTGYDVTVNVVVFPHLGEYAVNNTPYHGTYTGRLSGRLLNDRHTKGQFRFEDGTIIYRDKNYLE